MTNANSNSSYVRGPLRITQKGNGFCVDLLTQNGWKFIGKADELASNKEVELLRPLCDGRPMYKKHKAATYKVTDFPVTEQKIKRVWHDMCDLLFCGVCVYKDNLIDAEKHEDRIDDNITSVLVFRTDLLNYFQHYVAEDYCVSPTLKACCQWFNEIYTADDTDTLVDAIVNAGHLVWWKGNRRLLPYIREDLRSDVM